MRGAPCAQTRGCLPASSLKGSRIPYSRSTFPHPFLFPCPFLINGKYRVYDQYSPVIPLLGTIFVGDHASYQYLVESIRRFQARVTLAGPSSQGAYGMQCTRVWEIGKVFMCTSCGNYSSSVLDLYRIQTDICTDSHLIQMLQKVC